jgi:hypothetical protein
MVAISPRLVRSYVLVSRLKKNRSVSDLSGYEFVTTSDGRLPFFDHVAPGGLYERISDELGIVAWEETTRRCYLGYDGQADFSEVVLVWSWGKSLRASSKFVFRDFEQLLLQPSADAGFYLGAKAAFEALLWRAEILDDGNALCVPLREPAVRYLAAKDLVDFGNPVDDEEIDESMIEVYRSAMSPEEAQVVSRLEEAKDKSREEKKVVAEKVATQVVSSTPTPVDDSKICDEVLVENDDSEKSEATSEVKPPPARTPESIPPGFARARTVVKAP